MLGSLRQSSRKEDVGTKLRLDFARTTSVCGGVAEIEALDDDERSIIESLCTRAGMLMEDTSAVALLRASSDEELVSKVQQARSAVETMRRILDAVDALLN